MDEQECILIVGGAGYIGSHTNKLLTSRGYNTIVLDNLVYGHREFLKWGTFIEGDLADPQLLDDLFRRHRIKAVLHFAAYAYVGESVESPLKYYQNNLTNTIQLLAAMKEHGIRYFLFSSSCAVYGIPLEVPIREDHHHAPINPYGRTKSMVEQVLQDCSAAYGIRYVSLRYFNAAGADPDGELGEWHEPETHLIPRVLDAALGIASHVSVYGNDYATPDGTCIRDYIHVNDLADAHVRGLEHLVRSDESTVFNLGNGRGFSVNEVIESARRVSGRPIRVVNAPRRPGDPPALIGSGERAARVLGWQPKYRDIDSIVGTAWKWHQQLTSSRVR